MIRKELSFWPAAGLTVFEFVDARANLIDSGADALLETSADSYAVTRSAYLQRRNAEIEDRDDGTDGSGSSSDDAQLNAALDELGPANGAAAPQSGATTPEPTLAPDQPKATHPNDPAPRALERDAALTAGVHRLRSALPARPRNARSRPGCGGLARYPVSQTRVPSSGKR